jgi:hypothetical protein
MDVSNCSQQNFGMEPGTGDCIQMVTGLSTPCVTCYDNLVQCAIMHCLFPPASCGTFPLGAACAACEHVNCTPAFNACSGLTGP